MINALVGVDNAEFQRIKQADKAAAKKRAGLAAAKVASMAGLVCMEVQSGELPTVPSLAPPSQRHRDMPGRWAAQ